MKKKGFQMYNYISILIGAYLQMDIYTSYIYVNYYLYMYSKYKRERDKNKVDELYL